MEVSRLSGNDCSSPVVPVLKPQASPLRGLITAARSVDCASVVAAALIGAALIGAALSSHLDPQGAQTKQSLAPERLPLSDFHFVINIGKVLVE